MSNLQQRIISAVILGSIVLLLTWLGGWQFRIVAVLMGAMMFFEWQAMVCKLGTLDASGKPVLFALAIALGVGLFGIFTAQPSSYIFTYAVLVCVAGVVWLTIQNKQKFAILLPLGFLYALVSAQALAALRELQIHNVAAGLFAIVLLFAIVWSTDIFAYFGGKTIGGPKLAPAISPGKTISGAVVGTIAAVVVAVLVTKYYSVLSIYAIGLTALFVSVIAQIGDLMESLLKRRAGVKDSGNSIPGHGGVLDRVDGLAPAAIVLYSLAQLF